MGDRTLDDASNPPPRDPLPRATNSSNIPARFHDLSLISGFRSYCNFEPDCLHWCVEEAKKPVLFEPVKSPPQVENQPMFQSGNRGDGQHFVKQLSAATSAFGAQTHQQRGPVGFGFWK